MQSWKRGHLFCKLCLHCWNVILEGSSSNALQHRTRSCLTKICECFGKQQNVSLETLQTRCIPGDFPPSASREDARRPTIWWVSNQNDSTWHVYSGLEWKSKMSQEDSIRPKRWFSIVKELTQRLIGHCWTCHHTSSLVFSSLVAMSNNSWNVVSEAKSHWFICWH